MYRYTFVQYACNMLIILSKKMADQGLTDVD